jgi:large subunit ribosomal protein L35
MPKMKTNSSAKKRYRVTATGKVMHKQGGRRAKMEKQAAKVSRRLEGYSEVAGADRKKARRLLAR